MPDTVHLVPTGDAYIAGVPAVECDVDPETAAELLAYRPAAFVVAKRPKAASKPEPDAEPAPDEKEPTA